MFLDIFLGIFGLEMSDGQLFLMDEVMLVHRFSVRMKYFVILVWSVQLLVLLGVKMLVGLCFLGRRSTVDPVFIMILQKR